MATPLSGEYLRTRNTDTAPTNVVGYGTYHTSAAGVPKYKTAAGVDYAVNPSGPNVVTVGTLGDVTTIAAAIVIAAARTPSATNRITILLMPGVYAEQSLELPDYVDLIGTSRAGCIISMTSTNYDSLDARSSALVSAPNNSLVANLTINNTRAVYPSVALNLGWGWTAGSTAGKSPRAVNCVIAGAKEDVLYTTGGAQTIIVSGCQIYSTGGGDVWSVDGTDAASVHRLENSYLGAEGAGSPACAAWIQTLGRVEINNCRIRADSTNANRGAFRFADTTGANGSLYVSNSRIEGQTGAIGNVLENQTTGVGWNVYLAHTAHDLTNTVAGVTVAVEDLGDGDKSMGGNLQVDGATGVTAANGFVVNANTKLESGSLTIANGVIIYPDGTAVATDNPLKSTDSVTGTTGLFCTLTQWRYFDAVTAQYAEGLWTVTGDAYIAAVDDGSKVYFRVPYEPGSVITRLSVRWQGVAANDGVIFTLQKRQGGTATAAWATVGAAQTVTSASETNTVYDVADETMAAGYEYRVMVESQVGTTGSRLWEIGVETSKRAY